MLIPHGKTPRCTIRFLESGDYESFIDGYRSCLPAMNQFDEGRIDVSLLSRKWFNALLEKRAREAGRDYSYMFNVFRDIDGCSIGYCDITTQFREDLQYAKIGYTIFNNFWNNGFGTEVVRELTRIGFDDLGFHRLEAHINTDNHASKAVVLKCGYTFECVRKGFTLENDVWLDNEIYYINNLAWKKKDR